MRHEDAELVAPESRCHIDRSRIRLEHAGRNAQDFVTALVAEAIVERLSRRGYPAYVLGPTLGSPAQIYRVRVGSYLDRQKAQEVVLRLETEEKLKPWITR